LTPSTNKFSGENVAKFNKKNTPKLFFLREFPRVGSSKKTFPREKWNAHAVHRTMGGPGVLLSQMLSHIKKQVASHITEFCSSRFAGGLFQGALC
jgi:hypothetical protein